MGMLEGDIVQYSMLYCNYKLKRKEFQMLHTVIEILKSWFQGGNENERIELDTWLN